MGRRKRFPDRLNLPVVRDNCWLPMKDFPKIKREVELERTVRYEIRYFLMMDGMGDIVANWFVGEDSGWFHGKPNEFVAWAEVLRPREGE